MWIVEDYCFCVISKVCFEMIKVELIVVFGFCQWVFDYNMIVEFNDFMEGFIFWILYYDVIIFIGEYL